MTSVYAECYKVRMNIKIDKQKTLDGRNFVCESLIVEMTFRFSRTISDSSLFEQVPF